MKTLSHSRYETEKLLKQYLLFHYGTSEEQLPYYFGPHDSLDFPVRCVTECLNIGTLPLHARALDLGCAVGRSSFELSRYCDSVVGVDKSHAFIEAAKEIQQNGQIEYRMQEEGNHEVSYIARLPEGVDPQKVTFKCADAMDIAKNSDAYDVVLAANIICRLEDPAAFLNMMKRLVAAKGQLILTSPYSWMEEFTPQANWLRKREKGTTLEVIEEILGEHFHLEDAFNMPFLIRDHVRRYEWGVAQASLWTRS